MSTMRPLIIDATARAKIAHVMEHAENHHYHVGVDPTPGDDLRFVAQLGTYRAVFTYTHTHGKLFRHLSVSVPARNKFPNVFAVFMIAQEFGFTGWDGRTGDRFPKGWMGDIKRNENCVVIAQEIEE